MIISMDSELTRTAAALAWPTGTRSPFDVVAAPAADLPPGWDVRPDTDPEGETFVVVFHDDPVMPSFMFYEQDGRPRVGTVSANAWQGARIFHDCQDAVAAIIAATNASSS